MTSPEPPDHARGSGERPPAADRGLAARRAVLEILRAVRRHEAFDPALERAAGALPEADRRLVHEIAAGVLRSRADLDAILIPRVTGEWRRVTDDVSDILRIGVYQLRYLSRVPVHAAVAATVETAKREHGLRSAGFVNAVLRRVAKDAAEGRLTSDVPAPRAGTPDAQALAKRYAHPGWLVRRWLERFGSERTEALLRHNNRRPAVHLQAACWPLDRIRDALREAGVPFVEAPGLPGVAVQGVRIHELPGYGEGAFVVQDPAQALALAHVAVPAGARVWDACAAPGGKAAQLAGRCRVLASDPRRARLPRLVDTVRRAAPGVLVACADALAVPLRVNAMDVVLLDVPCSATGTIAKHPDAKWRITSGRIERLATLQAALLDAVAPVVRPEGLLAYMTCSLEPEENEGQLDRFLERHPVFHLDGAPLFLFPPDLGTDGAFAARLVRAA